MTMPMQHFSRFYHFLKHYLFVAWLPLLLVVIFVIQNHLFTLWLQIVPHLYFVRGTIAAVALGLLLYWPALFFRSHVRYLYLLIASALVSLVFIAEFLYYTYSGGFLQASAVRYVGEGLSITGTIVTLLTPKLLLFISNVVIVVVAWVCAIRYHRHGHVLKIVEKLAVGVLIVGFAMSGYGYVFAVEKKQWGSTMGLYTRVYDMDMLVGKVGIANFFVADAIKTIHREKVSEEDTAFVAQWQSKRATLSQADAPYHGIAKGRNLIFIQVESLDGAVIKNKVGDQEITPVMNTLADEGAYFSNYFAQIGQGTTADAEFVTLNSLYYLPDTVAFYQYAQNNYSALPQVLVDNGYHTMALHGDIPTFWNRVNIYPKLGYQSWYSKDDYTIPREVGYQGLGDDDFLQQSLPYLAREQKPFMATLMTLSSHTPFIIPQDLQTLDMPIDTRLSENQRNYFQSIHYVDNAIGNFIDGLKKEGLYDNSLIVIIGDHGSLSNSANALAVDTDTPPSLRPMRVPFILIAPGTSLHGTFSTPASHLDFSPTIANLLGISPPVSVLGQDLFSTKDPVVVSRRSLSGEIKTIMNSRLLFTSSEDGLFERGSCVSLPDHIVLTVNECESLFKTQVDILHVSDTVVRGNLLDSLTK